MVPVQQTSQQADSQQARRERLAARLRDNLRKRKRQQRTRTGATAPTADDKGTGTGKKD